MSLVCVISEFYIDRDSYFACIEDDAVHIYYDISRNDWDLRTEEIRKKVLIDGSYRYIIEHIDYSIVGVVPDCILRGLPLLPVWGDDVSV